MTSHSGYTLHHPQWLRRRVSTWWWLSRWRYFKFILREITSVFVAAAVVLLLLYVAALRRGPDALIAFQSWLSRPPILAASAVVFFFTLIHSITWFNLAPKAMKVRLGNIPVPPALIAAGHYFAWLVISLALAWIILTGG